MDEIKKTFFVDENSKEKVYIFLDSAHMLKLMRNVLGESTGVLIPGYRQPASWTHIQALYDYIKDACLRPRNQITLNHVQYDRHKMKVVYAAQILSLSTANALDFLRTSGVARFADSAATAELCRKID